ncbi:MAG: hypothetical protein L6U16_04455 [Porphyromonadaceae bacterium]|nr:MAG: hypothetical protein L6U16_04455 [Porphyromonadaceae bacterium]
MCVTFNSCNKGAGSGEAAAASEEPVEAFENAVTYENAQYGFSVQLPSDFAPQNNDEQLEKDRGGKLYIRKGCIGWICNAPTSLRLCLPQRKL